MSRRIVVNPMRYGECNNNHKFLTGGYAKDGCMEFMATQSDPYTCDACGCHRSFHRRDDTPLTLEEARYEQCCKNRVLKILDYSMEDGCLEFWPKDEEAPVGSKEALMCAACGCHRNFHQRKLETDVVTAAPRARRQPSPAYSDDY